MKNCSVIGLGYIGLSTALILSKNGVKVHGVDINKDLINNLNKGEIDKILKYVKNNKNFFVNRNDGWKISFNKIDKEPVRSIENWHPVIKNILINLLLLLKSLKWHF